MHVTHFSPYDCNDPIAPLEGVDTDVNDETSGNDPGPCANGDVNKNLILYQKSENKSVPPRH
jgi:hypothetical protein